MSDRNLPQDNYEKRQADAADANAAVSRREVLRGGLRGLAVATIAAVTGWLGWRSLAGDSPRDGGPDHSCSGDWICTSCRRLDDCVLPQAMSARNARESRQ